MASFLWGISEIHKKKYKLSQNLSEKEEKKNGKI